MPEEKFEHIDVLLERLVMLEKIERGIKDMEDGNVLSHDEAGKMIDKWFQK